MLKKILIALIVIIAAFLVDRGDAAFRVPRRANDTIAAPADAVFAQVNDLHKWDAWSPWAKLDPAAKIAFDGPDAGQGAAMSWSGNDKVGEGKMTIVESQPERRHQDQGRLHQAVRRVDRLGVCLQTRRRQDRCDLGHDRPSQLRAEGVLPGAERRQDAGRRCREGPRSAQIRGRAGQELASPRPIRPRAHVAHQRIGQASSVEL